MTPRLQKTWEPKSISKVQVYDEQSEQSKLTGIDDGKEEKTMNLELKEQYKKGSFGKITVAAGTEERWASRGKYNRFNSKEQLSFIGYANNINETGVNWEDYGEFRGQNAFNNYDNGDFGFGGGGGRVFYFNGGGDIPINQFDGRGFTENYGGGANYNFDNKKTKYNLSYFYNQVDRTVDQTGFRQTFLIDSTFFKTDTTNITDFRSNHSIATRLEQELDSSNLLIVKANLRFSMADDNQLNAQLFKAGDETPVNSLDLENSGNQDSWRITSAAIFRHKFKKKGRSWALSAGYNNSQTDGIERNISINEFFDALTYTEQIRLLNNSNNNSQQFKSSTLYTEPISQKWFSETFYNFSQSKNLVNRQVNDLENNEIRIDSLSVFYDNRLTYNRVGSSIRYAHNGLNGSAGLALQQLNLQGSYAQDEGEPLLTDPINRDFLNWVPYFEIGYEFSNNMDIEFDYEYDVEEPSLNDLQPIPNINNPAYRILGNPNLTPERSHSFDFNIGYWNPANFTNFNIGIGYNQFDNRIVYNQITEAIDSIGFRTTSRPDNVAGGNRLSGYGWSSIPIIKTKLSLSLNANVSRDISPAFVNGIENETTSNRIGMGARLNITPSQKLVLGINGYMSFTNTEYSIQSEQNQKIRNYNTSANAKWQFAPKFFFESNFNYAFFQNDRFGFDQRIPIWNASVRRLFGEKNKVEARLAVFDLLNQRVYINQNANQNYVSTLVAGTLARYFMLSVSYNVRGYEATVKNRGW
ncbi:MAG: TonB-dependent receptor [Saprospiraceae bacterium]